jgi:hypothetical protein
MASPLFAHTDDEINTTDSLLNLLSSTIVEDNIHIRASMFGRVQQGNSEQLPI